MTETAIVQTACVSTVLVLFAVFAWMPVSRGPRAFFGVRVDPGYFEGDGKRVLLRYRLTLAVVDLIIVAVAAGAARFVAEPVALVVAEFVLLFAAVIVYSRFASDVRPHAAAGATRFASSMRARDTRDRRWLHAIVAAFMAVAFLAPLSLYDEMPLRIPIHWDAAGKADGWVGRNIFAVLFIPALGAYLQFFLYVLRRDLAGAKMTLPADATEEYRLAKEKYLFTNIDTVDWARLTLAVALGSMSMLQTATAVERLGAIAPIARAGAFAGVAALLAGIAFFLVRMIRINARLQQQTGDDYAQRSVEESHWRHGGLTYANPEDPALVVEKMVGIGYTLNMAHPGIVSRLLLMMGIPLFVIWAVVAM